MDNLNLLFPTALMNRYDDTPLFIHLQAYNNLRNYSVIFFTFAA